MRSSIGIAVLGALALLVSPGWADDNAPKDPPKALLQKAVKLSTAQEGYHFRLKSVSAAAQAAGGKGGNLDGKGLFKKAGGYAHLEDATAGEMWFKGRKIMIKQPGEDKWKSPDSLGPMGSMLSRMIRTPNEIAEDMLKVAGTAKMEADEKVDEIDCWVVSAVGDKDAVKEYIKGQLEKMEGFGKLAAGAFDTDKGEISYKAWIGKDDGLIYRIENKSMIPTKPGGGGFMGMGAGMNIDQTTTADYLLYNKDLDLEVPAVIKTKLGIK